MQTLPKVKLLTWTRDWQNVLYSAYRSCYSFSSPADLWGKMEDGTISWEQVEEFLKRSHEWEHASPRYHINFTFSIEGVSRAFSHQWVRHVVGVAHDQQSQRYVKFRDADFPYVIPPKVLENAEALETYEALMGTIGQTYQALLKAGIQAEDARFILPNATETALQTTLNWAALRHISAQRLCTQAQWEIRHVMAEMRAEIVRKVDISLARLLQPYCGKNQLGYCPEPIKNYESCAIGRVVPHKTHVLALRAKRRGVTV